MPIESKIPLLIATGVLAMSVVSNTLADGVLVLGGTGQLGARVVKELLAADESVAVLVRPTSDRSRLNGLDVTYVVGDLVNADEVSSAIQQTRPRVIINTVRAPLSAAEFFERTSRHIVNAAEANGVQQIIHHGAVGAGDNMAMHRGVPWTSVAGLEARMLDQGRAEANFMASSVPAVVIRNSIIWPDRYPATGQAVLTEDQSTMTPMTRADLAILTMSCVDNPMCNGKIYHVRDDSLVGKERPPE